ncbi:MAG: hypothetical protein IPL26_01040 [Leptospiraceae bacterium]|nr:hypothetical protein [Leptospiraceae bacterium]
MKTKLLTILLSLALSFCLKANLNNIADPSKGSGIFYAYSLVPMALTGSLEVIPVALETNVGNLPTSIDNGTTINNIEVKFNKDIESDSTITVRSTDPMLKVNGLDLVTLSFTVANARTPQIVSLSASSESLVDVGVILEFESPLVPKTQKVVIVKNTGNQQALIVKDTLGVTLVSGREVTNTMPGDQFTYNVTLKYQPSENITILLETNTYSDSPTIDKTQIIFTPQNYNVPQSFTVTLAPISSTYQPSYIRGYSVYAKLTESTIGFSANYTQYVTPAIVVSGSTTINKGATSNLGISLSHMPDANRIVTVTLSQSNFFSLDKTSFTFTPANYNIPQTLQATVSSQDYIFGEITATFATAGGGYPSNAIKFSVNDPLNSYLDVSGGDVNSSGNYPSIVIDTQNSKLLIARTFSTDYYSSLLRLSICNLDGTSCSTKDISTLAGQGNGSGNYPSIAVDTVNSKILIATENVANNRKPSLFICNLDGSSCTHHDISAGRGDRSGESPKLLVDSVNNKVLLFTRNSESGLSNRLSLFRCNLNATSCTFSDISAGTGNQSAYSGSRIAAGIDTANSKLVVVTNNNFLSNNRRPSLFRCDMDGANCTYTDISTGQGDNSGKNPSLAIDSVNGKLYVTTSRYSSKYRASVFKCDLDGTSCSHTDLTTTYDVQSALGNSIAIDQTNSKVLVATTYTTNNTNYYPGLYRCSLSMTNCSFNNLALTGQSIDDDMNGQSIDMVIDTISAIPRVLVVATDSSFRKSYLARIIRNYVD